MLQRIQTVYMLASVVAILMMHFFWLASISTPEAVYEINSLGLQCQTPGMESAGQMMWELLILLLVMVALPLVTIFLYNHRKLQLRMLIYTAILDLCYYGLFFWDADRMSGAIAMNNGGVADLTFNYIMLAMPAVSVFALVMAMRGVVYDIALLKSLDRLR